MSMLPGTLPALAQPWSASNARHAQNSGFRDPKLVQALNFLQHGLKVGGKAIRLARGSLTWAWCENGKHNRVARGEGRDSASAECVKAMIMVLPARRVAQYDGRHAERKNAKKLVADTHRTVLLVAVLEHQILSRGLGKEAPRCWSLQVVAW